MKRARVHRRMLWGVGGGGWTEEMSKIREQVYIETSEMRVREDGNQLLR